MASPLDPERSALARARLLLVRHGESVGNERRQFTGWRDPALTERGIEQARALGEELRRRGERLDAVLCSVLQRALATARHLLASSGSDQVPVCDWRLNERHCGAFQGLTKDACKQRFGRDVLRAFRRDWHAAPPLAEVGSIDDPNTDARYRGIADLPLGESLAEVAARADAVWFERLRPAIVRGERILVVGHAIALRALLRRLVAGPVVTSSIASGDAAEDLPDCDLANGGYVACRFQPDGAVVVEGQS